MRSSLPVSLVCRVRLPLDLPNRFPSDFLRAKASVVREEIMERSISAARVTRFVANYLPTVIQ